MGRLILTQLLSLIVFLSCKLCCALYLRDSNFVERLVPSPELCHDQEIEYYPSPEGQSWPIRNHSIYRRTSAVYERPKAEVYDRSKRTYFQALVGVELSHVQHSWSSRHGCASAHMHASKKRLTTSGQRTHLSRK